MTRGDTDDVNREKRKREEEISIAESRGVEKEVGGGEGRKTRKLGVEERRD